MRFCLIALLFVSGFIFAGEPEKEEKPVQPVAMIIKGNEAFATIHVDITDLQKARKTGTTNDKGVLTKLTDDEFKLAVARRIAEQVTQSYNVMITPDVELAKRAKEAKARVDRDLEEAKKLRPNIEIED